MRRYEQYAPSGFDWLGDLPSHWSILRAKYVFREIDDRSVAGDEELLSVSHLTGVTPRSEKNVTMFMAEDYNGAKLCKDGDLVINTMWAWMGALGVSSTTGIVSPAYGVYRQLEQRLRPRYMDWLFRTPMYVAEYTRRSTGVNSSRLRLYPDRFLDMPVVIPPLEEQDRIVAFLDKKTTEIDVAVAKKVELLDLLEEQKKIVIDRAVTQGVHESPVLKSSGEGWIKGIPMGWHISPLLGVAEVIDPNPSHRNPKYTDAGLPFISTVEFQGDDDILLDSTRRVAESTVLEQEARCRFSAASIAFSRKGTIGAVRRLPTDVRFALLDSLCVVNIKSGMNVQFMYRQLAADVVAAQFGPVVRGAALKQLSVGRVRALKVLVPPEDEQDQIARHIDERLSAINAVVGRVKRQLAQLAELRQTIISAVVTGGIKV